MSSFEPLPLKSGDGEFRLDPVAAPSRFAVRADEELSGPAAGAPEPMPPEAALHEAYESGREAGRAELPFTEALELEQAAEALTRAATALCELRRDYLTAHREAIVELALAIARQLLGRAFEADPLRCVRRLEETLASVDASATIRVRIPRASAQLLEAGGSEPLALLMRHDALEVEASDALAPGEFELDAGTLHMDAQLEPWLARLREALTDCTTAEVPE